MSKQGVCGTIGFMLFVVAVGIVGGIDNGAPLGNFVYAFACVVGSFVAFVKGGMIE